MKLYDGGRAPNPRRVRIFLAEKGVSVPIEQVDLGALEHKSAEFSALNPLQRVPALVLDDGAVLTESIAICPSRGFLAAEPARRPGSRCGNAVWNFTYCFPSRTCFGISTRR